MLILTNCLTKKADEGCLKVASNLTTRIKAASPETCVVTYECQSDMSDVHLDLNKLMLSKKLFRLVNGEDGTILYIPAPARPIASVLRIFLLSLFSRKRISVILVMKLRLNSFQKLLLRQSNTRLIVFSKDAEQMYKAVVGVDRVTYLKTGINTKKFDTVSPERVKALKAQYGFDPERPVILHVGHLKYGRGISELMKIDESYQVLLVVSSMTRGERDDDLRQRLLSCPNIRIIDEYIPNIEQIYQLADVYFFPVRESGECIDVPLSCLEAAACGKPVITTDFGEMREFIGKPGFYTIEDMESNDLNQLIKQALSSPRHNNRGAVLEYDWDHAIGYLLNK